MDKPDDDELTASFIAGLKGDRSAYHAALTSIAELVRNYIRRRLSASQVENDVEDIVQNILITVHEKRATFERSQPLLPWVYGISRYKLLNHLRTHGRYRSGLTDQELDSIEHTHQTGDAQDLTARHDVQTMLDKLPPEQRTAVELTKLRGLSTEEAAIKAGTKSGTMKVRLHRAMKRLQDLAKES